MVAGIYLIQKPAFVLPAKKSIFGIIFEAILILFYFFKKYCISIQNSNSTMLLQLVEIVLRLSELSNLLMAIELLTRAHWPIWYTLILKIFFREESSQVSTTFVNMFPPLLAHQLQRLNQQKSVDEIKTAVAMAPFKAPVPDGLHTGFYQHK